MPPGRKSQTFDQFFYGGPGWRTVFTLASRNVLFELRSKESCHPYRSQLFFGPRLHFGSRLQLQLKAPAPKVCWLTMSTHRCKWASSRPGVKEEVKEEVEEEEMPMSTWSMEIEVFFLGMTASASLGRLKWIRRVIVVGVRGVGRLSN